MQTLTKRKERIFKYLDTKYRQNKSEVNPLFFLLEVEHLFPEEREVVSFLGKEDQERVREFEAIAERFVGFTSSPLNGPMDNLKASKSSVGGGLRGLHPLRCDCGGTIEQGNDYCVCDTCCKVSTVIEDSSRLPNSASTYDRKPKFRECISRYQARQDVVIDKRPYEKYLSRHYGDLSKVTKKQIFHMLINLGKEDQIKHIHLIHYEITGVPPNNIDYLEESLMCDFEVLIRGLHPKGASPLLNPRYAQLKSS